jgi:hypothetical protein
MAKMASACANVPLPLTTLTNTVASEPRKDFLQVDGKEQKADGSRQVFAISRALI